ncbi:MAG: DUF262 domain-containing protein [Nitrososphaerota archaeon]|jgi:hypothetical protein|nr:DUF262 domain-containing protein [Nitrososphaerota archaeon]
MDANAVPVLNVFERKVRLEVPLFQRQYVWNKDTQWEPLWADISRKFQQQIDGATDAPPHFLGALVLEQKQTPITHVERRQIIDGQQRLTTLQVFLAAFRDFAAQEGSEALAQECETFLLNTGMMANKDVDQFKVWPTQLDRFQFSSVVLTHSRAGIEAAFPLVRRWHKHYPDPRPRMIEAYLYFYDSISRFFNGDASESAFRDDIALTDRMVSCFNALRSSLKVVVIDLGKDDDPQVIFETLNARGEPLLPADLMRNYIFLRALREGEDQEKLYEAYWRAFDDEFWRTPVSQGHQSRPLSDLFMQYFVSSRRCTDVAVKHLYVEYKYWIEKEHPFSHAREELEALSRQGADFRRLVNPAENDVAWPLSFFLRSFELGTAYPFLLALLDGRPSDDELSRIGRILESYAVRRAVCGLTTKNYNRVFFQLARTLKGSVMSATTVGNHLAALEGPSVEWPTDQRFHEAWLAEPVYSNVGSGRVAFILRRICDTLLDPMAERLRIDSPLSVEHLMPQDWLENWPLPDGSTGMNWSELQAASETDSRAAATRQRSDLVQTMGNLTILTQELNSSVSNDEWSAKRGAILDVSLLPINQELRSAERWDEQSIRERGQRLYERALELWPRPSGTPILVSSFPSKS